MKAWKSQRPLLDTRTDHHQVVEAWYFISTNTCKKVLGYEGEVLKRIEEVEDIFETGEGIGGTYYSSINKREEYHLFKGKFYVYIECFGHDDIYDILVCVGTEADNIEKFLWDWRKAH